MRVLILAAGRGTRISRYLSGRPKCTVDIGGGQCLIRYTVELLKSRGVDRVGLVLGYREKDIRQALSGLDVEYYYNPFFDVTNSIASAWFARDFIGGGEDIMIMNGDVYVDAELLDRLLAEPMSPVMFADETRTVTADYKFYYENQILMKYGKELEGDDITGEYIGLGKFAAEFLPVFLEKMDEMIGCQKHSVWWENVLYELTKSRPIFVRDVGGAFWAEVDYVEDYERILAHRGYTLENFLQRRGQ